MKRVEQKAKKIVESEQELRDLKRAAGIILCDAVCPLTGRYCTGEFLTVGGYDKHHEKGKHHFLQGVNIQDRAVLLAANPGGAVAIGSRPDRLSPTMSRQVVEAPVGARGIKAAECLGMFNRKGRAPAYHKPEKLVKELERLYAIGSDKSTAKLTAVQIYEELKNMIDPKDGGLMFCYSKRGTFVPKDRYDAWQGCDLCNKKPCCCNGMLPPVSMIQSWINSQTQKKKMSQRRDAPTDQPGQA